MISALLSIPNRYGMMCCSSLKLIRRIYHFMLCILHWKRELCQIKGVSLSIKGKLQIIWKMNWFLENSKQRILLHSYWYSIPIKMIFIKIKCIAAILTKFITKCIIHWNIAANAPTWSKSIYTTHGRHFGCSKYGTSSWNIIGCSLTRCCHFENGSIIDPNKKRGIGNRIL